MSMLFPTSILRLPTVMLHSRAFSHALVNSVLPHQTIICRTHEHHKPRLPIHTSSSLYHPEESAVAPQKNRLRDSVYGFLDKHVGITVRDKYRWKDLNVASHVLLNGIYMKVDHSMIQKHANLEDSFESWLKIVYLHIWMLLVKLKQHGRDGKILSKSIVQILWQDIDARATKIQEELEQHLEIRKQMKDYYDLLRTSFILFDEGLLKGDAVLAGALWNLIYGCKSTDPRNLECLVHYIRFTTERLDHISLEHLVLDAENFKWPLPEKFGSYN